ncbi:MAG: 1-acyl-sn-glycerol-3-phosphate acyltransferase [Eubacterium sp.]|nr:1-acyl-sn-glycerol-3-phosphate acyltransferase [Eubacterium sp.]
MKREYYYTDEINDDFASTKDKIDCVRIDKSYRYSHRSPVWRITAFLAYRIFATPLVWAYTRIWLGVRVKNREALKQTKGCFLYLNHTQNIADAFIPTISAFPKRADIITGPETVSIRGVRTLVAMLGAIPLPSSPAAFRNYEKRLKEVVKEKAVVTVFPEAHIWPYCNFIRSFPDKSFSYPYRAGSPAIAGVIVYRQRRFFKKHHPHITVYLSDPIYPDFSLPEKEARKMLRDEVYSFMVKAVKKNKSYEYVKYIRKEKSEEH